LNAIIGMTDLLLKTRLDGQQQKYLKAVLSSSESLLIIINDILSFSKIESGKIELDFIETDLNDFLITQQNLFYIKAKEKDIDLTVDVLNFEDGYLIDRVRLGEVLGNLISNAIKFTMEGLVSIRCHIQQNGEEVDQLLFEIIDTGIGIPDDKLEHIFEHFTQANETITRNFGGTGLGLAISRELVQLMGGSLLVESTINKGSNFYFSLPLKKCVKPKSVLLEENVEKRSFPNLNVLLVDDNELNILLAQTILENWNVNVVTASNGAEAVEHSKSEKFDLVLMDIRMPVLGGVEATWIMRNKLGIDTPIVALTANVNENDTSYYIENGMNEVLRKPFREDELARVLLQFSKRSSIKKRIDLTHLIANFGENEALIDRMLTLFLETCPQEIEYLKNAVVEKDWKKIQQIAHKIKPSLNYISIQEMYNLAVSIEQENEHFVQENSSIFIEELEGLIAEIQSSKK
jgi:CheY-like chemotaxis protein